MTDGANWLRFITITIGFVDSNTRPIIVRHNLMTHCDVIDVTDEKYARTTLFYAKPTKGLQALA